VHLQQTSVRVFPAVSFGRLCIERSLNRKYGINCRPKIGAKLLDLFFQWRRQLSPQVKNATHRFFDGEQHLLYRNITVGSRHTACLFERPAIHYWPPSLACSAIDESEQVGIDHIRVRRAHAMRELLVDLQAAFLQEFCGERRGIRDRDDLVVDAITTFEESKYAYQSTLDLLHHTPDLVGLFIAGGGKSGVLRGLREDTSGLAKTLNVVGLDLTPQARSGLLDGVVDVILSHPIMPLAETTVELLASVTAGETNGEPVQRVLPFEIYTPENL
jgi:hypothetical protein